MQRIKCFILTKAVHKPRPAAANKEPKKKGASYCQPLDFLEPMGGFEPPTY
jgi:hypothetical protein